MILIVIVVNGEGHLLSSEMILPVDIVNPNIDVEVYERLVLLLLLLLLMSLLGLELMTMMMMMLMMTMILHGDTCCVDATTRLDLR